MRYDLVPLVAHFPWPEGWLQRACGTTQSSEQTMATVSRTLRGADLLTQTLDRAGYRTIFTLSGNHIMPVFDATLGTELGLIHTRHEAAAVHMADATARLTGDVGIVLVTGGQGHTNAVAALTTAQCADSPLVLLSGHAGTKELGRGAFQELDQVALARPVTKAAWMVRAADRLGHDVADAIRIAKSGRPGPVHLSLPVDLLEARLDDTQTLWPATEAFAATPQPLTTAVASRVLASLAAAKRPLILAGPMLCTQAGRALLARLQATLQVPAIPMESPRGINDPSLGAFAEVFAQADLLVLLGKPHDFTLRFGAPPFVHPAAAFVVIDPDTDQIERATREQGGRIVVTASADATSAAQALLAACTDLSSVSGVNANRSWPNEVSAALSYRPALWHSVTGHAGMLHPAELCRAIQPVITAQPDTVFIADGGEIGQWAQAGVTAKRRVINGVAGSIGAGLPFALAARIVEPDAPVIAVMGDGTIGFHLAEFDTAVRHNLPFVAVVGNDASWGAEHQIQVRDYGADRAHSCGLLPTRYDQVAVALGGHGELVTESAALAPALERAIASGKPACVNVMIESHPAPVVRRPK
jgi:acetolactate synthase I/II/III large subunit